MYHREGWVSGEVIDGRTGYRRHERRGGSSSSQMVTWWARRRRPPTLVVVVLAMLAGVSLVYLRLWAMDSGFSSNDEREYLRKQFDRANMEAMDESAEWRMKYDEEAKKARQCQEKAQQEKSNLNAQLVHLRSELDALRHNCTCNLTS